MERGRPTGSETVGLTALGVLFLLAVILIGYLVRMNEADETRCKSVGGVMYHGRCFDHQIFP